MISIVIWQAFIICLLLALVWFQNANCKTLEQDLNTAIKKWKEVISRYWIAKRIINTKK
jgi:hypothetical protein